MDFEYTIVRSTRRRKLTITVERDRSVVVHAPESTPEEKICQVVETKRQWILGKMNHHQKYRDLPHPPGKELVNGESTLYLGRHYRIEVVKTGLSEIRFNQRFYIPAAHVGKRREVLREWYIQRAEAKIIPRVKHHTRELGVTYSKAKIVDNLYRWGSCTVNNNVNFNWRLIKAPMFVIDYAIIHELAHLIEDNHTPRFWNIVRAQAPTMEKA
ncbi:MAG: M48 family metallopeptidase, partial [Desulfosarcina sp.]|nr:M48 family metallopeptidase [Desulfosarcina sp.]MBC2767850.1 M48 family metallopeptidase [Desulfosarcina sp.]